jgi:hypothetical protein
MAEQFEPLSRHFSALGAWQQAHTLFYALDKVEGGAELTICRTGAQAVVDHLFVPGGPELAYTMLRYLWENAVQPEHWRDVLADLAPLQGEREKKGGVLCEK